MLTNQRILGIILILFIIGAGTYFAVSKFRQEVGEIGTSPSPFASPALTFVLDQLAPATPTPQPATGQSLPPSPKKTAPPNLTPTPTPAQSGSALPYSKNKYVGHFPGVLRPEVLINKKAVVETNKGQFELEIYPEAAKAASNFMLLAVNGFYERLTFHRVVADFVVQGGDPLGNGTGGPGYVFEDEAIIREYTKGIVAYANAGPNTNGSQFFILLKDQPELPKKYTIFGNVISGMEVVEKIAEKDMIQKITIQSLR